MRYVRRYIDVWGAAEYSPRKYSSQIAELTLEDLIYNFLLQSNFPRASILVEADLLDQDVSSSNGTLTTPSFIIVDPETAKPLAVINTVAALDEDILRTVSIQTRNYCSQLGGKAIQGFVIRVDLDATTEEEQVQFYRIWPNKSSQQLTTKSFPDIDTLKVSRKLADAKNERAPEKQALASTVAPSDSERQAKKMILRSQHLELYLPAVLLLVLMLLDILISAIIGSSWLSTGQCGLAATAALFFTAPALIRYLRKK